MRRAVRRVLRGRRASFRSQAAFREAVLDVIRRDEPLATVGGPRLRKLLVATDGVRLAVHYTERAGATPPTVCPVCEGPLAPIRNRTLTGESVELGRRCTQCDYWTHAARRVPVRYAISRTERAARSRRAPP